MKITGDGSLVMAIKDRNTQGGNGHCYDERYALGKNSTIVKKEHNHSEV